MLFTLLLVSLSGVGAQLSSSDPEPQKCCVSRQFSAKLYELNFRALVPNGEGSFIQGYQYMNYDYDAKLMSFESHRIDPATGHDRVSEQLFDFNKSIEYMRHPVLGGGCYIQPIMGLMREPCILVNATFLGRADYGFRPNTLSTNAWEFGPEFLRNTLVVTEHNCFPAVIFETHLEDIEETAYIFDSFSPSINDRRLLKASTWAGCDVPMPHYMMDENLVGKRFVPFG